MLGDVLGTMALGRLVYRGVLGLGGMPDLAAAGMAGAVGWEVVRRRLLPKLLSKLRGQDMLELGKLTLVKRAA